MKINDSEAHVGLGSDEVKQGDSIALFKNKCGRPPGGLSQEGVYNDPVCQKIPLGDGEITRVLNRQFSVARIAPGVEFDESTIVEKK